MDYPVKISDLYKIAKDVSGKHKTFEREDDIQDMVIDSLSCFEKIDEYSTYKERLSFVRQKMKWSLYNKRRSENYRSNIAELFYTDSEDLKNWRAREYSEEYCKDDIDALRDIISNDLDDIEKEIIYNAFYSPYTKTNRELMYKMKIKNSSSFYWRRDNLLRKLKLLLNKKRSTAFSN